VVPILASALQTSDTIWVIAITAICTILAGTLFINSFVNFESRFVQWFSHITSSPRWFTIWILIMVLWVPLRHLLIERGALHPDADFVVATVLWSGVPFMVENLLKSTSAKAMQLLTELVISIKEELDRSSERDKESAQRDESLLRVVNAMLERLVDKKGGDPL